MYNFYSHISTNSNRFRRLACGDSLLTVFNCGEKNQFDDLWSPHNYIIYVAKGRKIWHMASHAYDLREGSFIFIRKGACIIEQFFDTDFCFFLFFVSDDFICDVLRSVFPDKNEIRRDFEPAIRLESNDSIRIFYDSMLYYFDQHADPGSQLLELKFRELLMLIASNPKNETARSFFCSMIHLPGTSFLKQVMEDNYCFNLKLPDFAKLCARSLSAFKRDFQEHYQMAPGKWLIRKRLEHAKQLLSVEGKSVADAAFESGFENASHFSRVFRQHYGVPPSAMRQSQLN